MEKVSFPKKTKIAAWWIIGIGGVVSGYYIFAEVSTWGITTPLLLALVYFLFPFFLGFSILKRRKWAWWGAITALILGLILLIYLGCLFLAFGPFGYLYNVFGAVLIPTIGIVPLILLLLDRKNFWKIIL